MVFRTHLARVCIWKWKKSCNILKYLSYMKLADKYDAFENISNNRRVEHRLIFFYGLMLKKEMCMLHVHVYLPRKVVWNFILIRKVARKKRLLILHQSLTFARADNAEWIFPLLVSSYTCSIHMWSWETCIQSLCGKMAKQQSSLVNFFSKISTKWRSGRFVDIFYTKVF